MIIRLWHARLRPTVEPELLARLRALIPRLGSAAGLLDFTYGFRQEAGRTRFLTLSVWPDLDAVLDATGGDLDRTVAAASVEDLLEEQGAEIFERLGPNADPLGFADGRVLGVVTGRVRPQHEAPAQDMVDRSAAAALGAGALAAHVGRRLVDGVTELAIIVIWPKRDTMTRFIRSREVPAVDPAFTAHLLAWHFETYRALAPERLLEAVEGPAVLVSDIDGRFVDATPGVESVLGIPGELLHGRSILDLAPDPADLPDIRRRFLETAVSHGTVTFRRPDGEVVRARYRSVADVPDPGLRVTVLTLPNEPDDDRPTAFVALEALGLPAAAEPVGEPS
jgi:PAS domain-containing protein